jgi:hypothetical protein
MPIHSVSSDLIIKATKNVTRHTAVPSLLKETTHMSNNETKQHWCALCGLCTYERKTDTGV